ncbi:hypothetical protein DMP17_34190 [Pseudonocardia sp. TMWB2A]
MVPPRVRGPRWTLALAIGVVATMAVIGAAVVSTGPRDSAQTDTAAAPAAAAPTYAYSAPTTSAPPPDPAPQSFTGTGDEVVRLDSPRDTAVVTFSCKDCSSNVIVKSDEDTLVNEIGSYSGTTLYGIRGSSSTAPLTRLQITADAAWTLTIGGIDTAREVGSFPVKGSADDVIMVDSPRDVARLTHDGDSNFVVYAISGSDSDLVVNEIGAYEGTVILPADGGRLLLVITADGNWTVD